MATNMFLKLDGIKGESADSKHKEWIEILSWNHSFNQPTSPVRDSSGATVERCNHSDLSVTKYLDQATDNLLSKCWSGKVLKTGKIECFRSDGDNKPIKYLMIDMDKVVISNLSISAGGGDIPMENLSLSYGKVKYTYIEMKEDGKAAGAKPVSHDLIKNEVSDK
jgi:type VI secretion system secreted protein Hcp